MFCDIIRQEVKDGPRVIAENRRLRGAGAVRAAVSVRDVADAASGTRRGSRTRTPGEFASLARMLKDDAAADERDAADAALQSDRPQRAAARGDGATISITGTSR